MTKNPIDINQHPFDTVQLEIISKFLEFINQIQNKDNQMKVSHHDSLNTEKSQKSQSVSGHFSLFSSQKKSVDDHSSVNENKIRMK